MLPHNLSDTAATSKDGSSLEFIATIVGRQCYIQDAEAVTVAVAVAEVVAEAVAEGCNV